MRNALSWPVRLAVFTVWFFAELTTSTLRVVRTIVTREDTGPQVVTDVRTGCRNEPEIALLALTWSLTPGTLVLATHRDRDGYWWLAVHDIYASGPLDAQSSVRRLEEHLFSVTRLDPTPAAGEPTAADDAPRETR